MNGYVKLHRKIEKWEWFNEPNTFRLFIYLMLNANHEKGKWRGIEIDRGQLITGRKQLSTKLELTERQIRTCLANLESTNEIAIKTTNKFSLVTLTQYDFYQSRESEATSETTNNKSNKRPTKSPTNDQQTTTNKNEKNKEEEKNIYRQFDHLAITHEEVDKLLVDYTTEQIDDILDRIENYKNKKDYTSLYLTAKTWLKKEPKKEQPKPQKQVVVSDNPYSTDTIAWYYREKELGRIGPGDYVYDKDGNIL